MPDEETEWGVRFDFGKGGLLPSQAVDERGREEALEVARRYGYGTPESQVSIVHRTVTYGPWVPVTDPPARERTGSPPDEPAERRRR